MHELGHGLGLDHSPTPDGVPRGRSRPLRCTRHPRSATSTATCSTSWAAASRTSAAYARVALGLDPLTGRAPRAAPSRPCARSRRGGRRCCACGPRRTTTSSTPAAPTSTRGRGRMRAPRGAAIVRVRARYARRGPRRSSGCRCAAAAQLAPAADPRARRRTRQRPCRAGTPAASPARSSGPGAAFTVPGAFRLRVLAAAGRSASRPAGSTARRRRSRVAAARDRAAAQARRRSSRSALRTAAHAAPGVARIEVEQGGAVARGRRRPVPGARRRPARARHGPRAARRGARRARAGRRRGRQRVGVGEPSTSRRAGPAPARPSR